MLKKILSIFCLTIIMQNTFSQGCIEVEKNKILLVGDSWAFFMLADGTFNRVFQKWGYSNYSFLSNSVVAENGARTNDFLEAEKLNEIRNLLQENPEIEVVHLSIGGNDVLGNWNVNFTQQELDDLVDLVYGQVLEIIDSIKTMRTGIRIVFSGYTYPNFEEVIESANPFQTSHPFYSTWSGMQFPSFLQINTILNDFSMLVENYAATDTQVDFVNATGILQYTFGQTTPLGVAPGGTYDAFTQPLPFGNPSYPSPQNSMRDYLLTKDCFHLSARGYRDFIEYQFQKFYQKYFMGNNFILANQNIEGSVSSSLSSEPILKLGLDSGEDFAVVLDFQTQGADFGTYNSAQIFMRIESVSGNNPLNTAIELSVKTGFIGNNQSIEGTDWNATFDATITPCVFGKKDGAGDWIRIEIPQEMMPYISSTNNTQFMIKALNSFGFVTFSSAQNTDFAAVLNLKIDSNITSVQNLNHKFDFNLYPNPATQSITIEGIKNTINEVKIFDIMGKLCFKAKTPLSNTFSIENLSKGSFIIELTFKEGVVSKQFIKQ